MNEEIAKDVSRYAASTEKLVAALENFQPGGNFGNSEIHVNAGGLGVLITTGLSAFMAGVILAFAVLIIHQQKQIDDLHDYLNVIYQYAPQLKPGENHVSDNHNQSAKETDG